MSEPKRIVEGDAKDLASLRAMLRVARGDLPNDERIRAIGAGVGQALAGGVAPPVATSSIVASGAFKVGAIAVAVLLGAAGATYAVGVWNVPSRSTASTRVASAPAPSLASASASSLAPAVPTGQNGEQGRASASPRASTVAPAVVTWGPPAASPSTLRRAPSPAAVDLGATAAAPQPVASALHASASPVIVADADAGAGGASSAPLGSAANGASTFALTPGRTGAPSAPGPTPATELDLLQRASDALRIAPETALALADDHARRFPNGSLSQEREVIAIEALVRLGRMDEARERGARLLRVWPDTAHAPRVRALLDDGADGSLHKP